MDKLNNSKFSLDGLKSPWAILISVVVGVYIGFFKQEYVELVSPIGAVYLDILKMCVLPILVSAISLSIGRLCTSKGDTSYLKRMLVVFLMSVFIAGTVGALSGVVGQPGNNLGSNAMSTLGTIVQSAEAPDLQISIFTPYVQSDVNSVFTDFLFGLVPDNIFSALSTGNTLKVLFFAIIFGLAVGSLRKDSSDHMLSTLDAIYGAFTKLVNWLMYLLPFGLCGLLAQNLSKVGVDVLFSMINFIVIALCAFAFLCLLSLFIVWGRTGHLTKALFAFKDPILIALGTSNSLACLPTTMTAMSEKLGYDKGKIGLLVPLTFTLCRIGPTLYFALATIFVAQLYDVTLGTSELLLVIFGAVLAGVASAGSSGIALLSMLTIVLSPLGLPFDAVIILFIVVDPIIAPFRVATIVVSAIAVTTTIMPKIQDTDEIQKKTLVKF
jgi:proton glutamate symport protein